MKEQLTEKMIREHKVSIHAVLKEEFERNAIEDLEQLDNWLENYQALSAGFFKKLEKISEKQDKIRIIHEHILYRKTVLEQLDSWIKDRKTLVAKDAFSSFEAKLDDFLHKQPVWWVTNQKEERFLKQPLDSRWVAFKKLLKRIGYAIHILPAKFKNYFNKLTKRPINPLPVWKQNIPVKKLSLWYYQNFFLLHYKTFRSEIMKDTALIAKKLWAKDDDFYQQFAGFINGSDQRDTLFTLFTDKLKPGLLEMKQEIAEKKSTVAPGIDAILVKLDAEFDQQTEIAGTLEFSSMKFRTSRRKRYYTSIARSAVRNFNRRHNTLYTLADDWKFNQEIYILKGTALKSMMLFQSRIKSRAEVVSKSLEKIPVFLQQINEGIQQEELVNLRKNLQQLKYSSSKTLISSIIPEVSDLILEQGFPVVIDEAEQGLQSELANMTHERILIEDFDPAKDYNSKSLQAVNPLEIIDFEMIAGVKKTLLSIKTFTIEKLERINNELEHIGRMVVFNLDSAMAMLDEQGDEATEQSYADAKASMERAIQNYFELKSLFDTFIADIQKRFGDSTEKLSLQLNDLTDNRRVAEIRYRIARAKALKKGGQAWIILKNFLKAQWQNLRKYYKFSRKKIDSGVQLLKGQLGIREIPSDISFEISDYLVSGDARVMNLPFVYRRLFVNEPLKDATFFLPRKSEFDKLDKAFINWKNDAFAPVLIYGEKGSGISSFVHMFVKEKIRQSPVVYSVLPVKRIQTEEDLLAMLGMSFRGQAFTRLQELYEFTDEQEPFVAYLDKLHLMFLRQPGGFNILKKFFEIISHTSKKVFWICTCGMYASLYLDKSVGLYDYFPVLIQMKNLSRDEVRKMIMMRHKASGYELLFKPSANDIAERGFQKKNPDEKQEFLMEKYFSALNRFSQSNIAFAMNLWLRSAEKPQENRIELNSLDTLDFSFIFNLPTEVIFGLHALIMHEKLDVFQLSQVLSISRRQAYLLLMRLADRGIVKEEKGQYTIHQLLYRQTILLLKDKNLIH